MSTKFEQKRNKLIIAYYNDPFEEGAFSGLDKFKKALKKNHNIDISSKELKKILFSVPSYRQFLIRGNRAPQSYRKFNSIFGAR